MRFREQSQLQTSVVFGAGWIHNKESICRNRDWQAYALVYLTVGSGTYSDANGLSRTLSAGDLLVLFPGLRHSYGPLQPGIWTEAWLGFRGPVFSALEADGVLTREQPVMRPGLKPSMIARFDALVAAVDRAGGTSDTVLVARLHQYLADLATAERSLAPTSLVARARAELESNLRHPLDLPQLSHRLGVSYDTLRRAFHHELGTSPGHWRLLRRIERAKQCLAEGATLEDAAIQAGFCDRFFLARQFKKVVGTPPGRWRQDLLGTTFRE